MRTDTTTILEARSRARRTEIVVCSAVVLEVERIPLIGRIALAIRVEGGDRRRRDIIGRAVAKPSRTGLRRGRGLPRLTAL